MTRDRGQAGLRALLQWLHRGEDALMALLLTLTLGVAIAQIVLRNLFDTSILWADPTVRVLVLWLGMLGAMIATRDKKHISIDLISRYLTPRRLAAVEIAVSLFAGAVCAAAGYYSLVFVINEFQAGEVAFAGVPSWLCQTILPTAFSAMALRYLLQSALGAWQWRKVDRS